MESWKNLRPAWRADYLSARQDVGIADAIILLRTPAPFGQGRRAEPILASTTGTKTTNLSVSRKWGGAVYTTFTTAYDALEILPARWNSCSGGGGDQAGTPEGIARSGISYKSFVTWWR